MTSFAWSNTRAIPSWRRKKHKFVGMRKRARFCGMNLSCNSINLLVLLAALAAELDLSHCDSWSHDKLLLATQSGNESSRQLSPATLDRHQAASPAGRNEMKQTREANTSEFEDENENENENENELALDAAQEGAQFWGEQARRVIASSDHSAKVFLPCKILNLEAGHTVSWIRKRDSLVLTIDKLRLVDDARFQLSPRAEDFTLALSQPRELDAGFYECQVSSMEPKLSRLVELRMVRAHSFISNFSSLFVRPGELVNLTCTIRAAHKTNFVYWYKNVKEVVLFDGNLRPLPARNSTDMATRRRPGSLKQRQKAAAAAAANDTNRKSSAPLKNVISVEEANANAAAKQHSASETSAPAAHWSSSSLIIKQAQPNDTANYTCMPSNAKASHISLVVIENGLGSQPEKRSLQADSGACQIRRPTSVWNIIKYLAMISIEQIHTQSTSNALQADDTSWTPGIKPVSLEDSLFVVVPILATAHQFRLHL